MQARTAFGKGSPDGHMGKEARAGCVRVKLKLMSETYQFNTPVDLPEVLPSNIGLHLRESLRRCNNINKGTSEGYNYCETSMK